NEIDHVSMNITVPPTDLYTNLAPTLAAPPPLPDVSPDITDIQTAIDPNTGVETLTITAANAGNALLGKIIFRQGARDTVVTPSAGVDVAGTYNGANKTL